MSSPENPSPTPPEDPNKQLPEMSLEQMKEFEKFMEQKEAEEEAEEAALKAKWKKEEVKKDALRIMSKIPLVLIVGYLIFQTYIATTEYNEGVIEDQFTYTDSLNAYQDQVKEAVAMRNSQLDVDPKTLGVTEILDDEGMTVTTGNFEGPQLFIEGMEFGDEFVDVQKHHGILDYSVTSLNFDPDHDKLGLPNLDVRVSPVRIYQPETGALKEVFDKIKSILPGKSGGDKPEPYAVYTKDVELGNGTIRKMAMQLWLTEFKVTVGVKPDMLPKKQLKAVQNSLEDKLKELEKQEQEEEEQAAKAPKDTLDTHINQLQREQDSLELIIQDTQGKKAGETEKLKKQEKKLAEIQKKIDRNDKRLINRPKARGLNKKKARFDQEKALEMTILNRSQNIIDSLNQILQDEEKEKTSRNNLLFALNQTKRELLMAEPPFFRAVPESNGLTTNSTEEKKTYQDAENKDQVYDDVKIWLRVLPNASPWYIKTGSAENLRPKMAIGAIYCTKVQNALLEDDMYELKNLDTESNASEGIAMALFDRMELKRPMGRDGKMQEITPLKDSNHYMNESEEASIWNKPYHMKLFMKNIGSYTKKSGKIKKGLKAFDDQYTFTFLMPLLVRGSWDVMAPDEVIPDWNPPEPRIVKGFQFSHILPDWGIGIPFVGKSASLIIMIGAVLFVLNFFFPGLKDILVFLGNTLRDIIIGAINGIKSLFSRKKS